MTLLDNSFHGRAAGIIGSWEQRWKHPRLLALAFVLALGSSFNAVVNGDLGPDSWKDAALLGAGTQVAGTLSGADWDRAKTCGRIQQIVETACGLKQYDHDPEGIRQCIAYERKYTLWSAYGCR
ncbi:hypothetical protein AAFN88_13475 [Pelagibius sp. CAU 1746]|uniref:hypothetical protein n=1 Tax=Pelagibius sp. CAU 1746 TaxID=3140370 RepID=UPI00325B39EE